MELITLIGTIVLFAIVAVASYLPDARYKDWHDRTLKSIQYPAQTV